MSKKPVKVKILPPLTPNMKSVEMIIELNENTKIIELLKIMAKENMLKIDTILNEDGELKDNIVILVDGVITSDLLRDVRDVDKIVIMPLAPGG